MEMIKWGLDNAHSEIGFKVKHLMISSVKGSFSAFTADVATQGDDFATATIKLSIDTNGINTGNADRDAHLKSPDFFNAANFPSIDFISESLTRTGDDEYQLTGELTIKGVSKKVVLNAEFGGTMTDPWGNVKAGFSVTGSISRSDFGLTWNAALETGGVLVGDEVKISAEVQFARLAS